MEICGVESAHTHGRRRFQNELSARLSKRVLSLLVCSSVREPAFYIKRTTLKSELLMLLAVCYYNNINAKPSFTVCVCITSDGNSWFFEIITDKFNRYLSDAEQTNGLILCVNALPNKASVFNELWNLWWHIFLCFVNIGVVIIISLTMQAES